MLAHQQTKMNHWVVPKRLCLMYPKEGMHQQRLENDALDKLVMDSKSVVSKLMK